MERRDNALAALRDALAATGRDPWRSLDELAETEEFRQALASEFPSAMPDSLDGPTRRQLLAAMAASLAMAGLTACTQEGPAEEIVPYVRKPEDLVPGRPRFFATAVVRDGWAHGVVVESHTGRPTKIEGNPDHPINRGATDPLTQAEVLTLYDPDRSRSVREFDEVRDWEAFSANLRVRLADTGGAGLALLTGNVTSPTLLRLIGELLDDMPGARWFRHQPVGDEAAREGARIAFGRPLRAVPDLTRAAVIVSLADDLFYCRPASVQTARDFAAGRRARAGELTSDSMNRLYVLESTPTVTGSNADHRLPLAPAAIGDAARAIAAGIGLDVPEPAGLSPEARRVVEAIVSDLERSRERGVVLVGEGQPPWVHALGHLINSRLGSLGTAVKLLEPAAGPLDERAGSLEELADAVDRGDVATLLVVDANPVYDAPGTIGFGDRLDRVPYTVHLGLWRDETGRRCRWHLPMAHALESWGDARAADGTATVLQPLIEPMFGGKTAVELLGTALGRLPGDARTLVRDHWRTELGPTDGGGFDGWWEDVLRRGTVAGTAAEPVDAEVAEGAVLDAVELTSARTEGSLDLVLVPDGSVWDGHLANNAWLQELPEPLTTISWGHAALLPPRLALEREILTGDVVRIGGGERSIEVPVWVLPGQADGVVTVSLGYGRSGVGRVADGLGANAYSMRTTEHRWHLPDIELVRTGRREDVVTTQNHHSMEGRHQLRRGTITKFVREPEALARLPFHDEHHPSLYPVIEGREQQWGMSIDLTACIGCGACTIACQAENNIPVVGREQVRRGREMHWIRIDHYFEGPADRPAILHQPIPCMHCEKAPCELVCPTGATQHSSDGLNEMLYQRCIGTRYCSNNCPYKVRRFNFLLFSVTDEPLIAMQKNPDVTVRGRGVMEKCSYCVQRIRAAEIDARTAHREIGGDEVVPACAQVCPTRAIVFGRIDRPDSEVSRAKREPHDYGILTELNTRPRTTYLAAVTNPHPALAAEVPHAEEHVAIGEAEPHG